MHFIHSCDIVFLCMESYYLSEPGSSSCTCAINVLAPTNMVSLLSIVGLLCVALPSGSSSSRHLSIVVTRSSQMLSSSVSSCKSCKAQ